MSVRWTVGLFVCVAPSVAAMPVYAQDAAGAMAARDTAPPSIPRPEPHRNVRAKYDGPVDSTRWSVLTHKGKYFLWVQRPRLTWSVAHAGREPGGQPPQEVTLEFRTQQPQVALDSRLVIASGGGDRLEVASSGAYSDPGVVTWSHFMRFGVPGAELARVLAGEDVTVTVGGIHERLKPDHVEALRSLLEQIGTWPMR